MLSECPVDVSLLATDLDLAKSFIGTSSVFRW
jgi:hypothetical protein